jgi:hypothetical protein
MESRSDYPHTKAWETPPRANILSPNKPPTDHIQSPRQASFKKTPPNGGKKNQLIPNHQFGFRQRHSTIEQTHRIVQRINKALERKQYCSAAFLYITQAFGIVWHTGLLYKLKLSSFELVPCPKILPAKQTFPRQN